MPGWHTLTFLQAVLPDLGAETKREHPIGKECVKRVSTQKARGGAKKNNYPVCKEREQEQGDKPIQRKETISYFKFFE